MSDLLPGQLFRYDRPLQGSPTLSSEMRDYLQALARTHYTDNGIYPEAPRLGQLRIFADPGPPLNVRLQWYDGAIWRTLLQNIEGGQAAPAKQIVDVNVATDVWTIDHNLGSQPLVQVFDSTWKAMQPFNPIQGERSTVLLARLSSLALAGVPPGPPFPVRLALPLSYNGLIAATGVAIDEPTLAPFLVDFSINSLPITGGTVSVPPAPPGFVVPGAAVTTATFVAGDVLDILITTAAPIVGAVDVFGVMQRTPSPGEYVLEHPTLDRIIVTHDQPQTGHVVIIG